MSSYTGRTVKFPRPAKKFKTSGVALSPNGFIPPGGHCVDLETAIHCCEKEASRIPPLRETYNSIRSSLITQGLADGPLFLSLW